MHKNKISISGSKKKAYALKSELYCHYKIFSDKISYDNFHYTVFNLNILIVSDSIIIRLNFKHNIEYLSVSHDIPLPFYKIFPL